MFGFRFCKVRDPQGVLMPPYRPARISYECRTITRSMTDPPRVPAATAGFTLLGAVLFCAAIGAGIGLAVGSVPLPTIAGVFIGFGVGFWLVYTRFKRI